MPDEKQPPVGQAGEGVDVMFGRDGKIRAGDAGVAEGGVDVSAAGQAYNPNAPGELKIWDTSTFRVTGQFDTTNFPVLRGEVSADLSRDADRKHNPMQVSALHALGHAVQRGLEI